MGVSVEGDAAKWLDQQSQALTNNDVLELEKETAATRPDTPVGQLTLKWVTQPFDRISVTIATFEACSLGAADDDVSLHDKKPLRETRQKNLMYFRLFPEDFRRYQNSH